MLDFMRRQAQGWIVKVLFALIVLSFAMWGVGDYFSGQSTVTVAKVADQPITQQALQFRVQDEQDRLRRMLGASFDPDPKQLKKRVLRQMIRERLLDLETARLGLTAPDEAVVQAIHQQPAFQRGGGFSQEVYESRIRRPSAYEARTRRRLATQGLLDLLTEGTVITEQEVWRAFRRENERRTVRYFRLSPSAFADRVALTEGDLKAYYAEHTDAYRRPAQTKVRYVVLSPESLAGTFEPEPGELERFFKATADRYAGEDGEVPELSEVRERVRAEWRRQQAEDRIFERLETFKDLLYTRDDLETAAEEFGLEVRTSPWIPEKGELPEAVPQAEAFRKAAFGIKPGRNSEAVELGDARFAGLHVVERRAPAAQELAAVKAEVRRDLRRERARELAREAAEKARGELNGGRSLEAVAADYGVAAETVEGVTRAAKARELPDGLGAPVFAAAEGQAGTAQVGRVDLAVFRVAAVTPPGRDELDDQRRQELAAELRRQRGEARVEGLYDRLRQRYEVRVLRDFGASRG